MNTDIVAVLPSAAHSLEKIGPVASSKPKRYYEANLMKRKAQLDTLHNVQSKSNKPAKCSGYFKKRINGRYTSLIDLD